MSTDQMHDTIDGHFLDISNQFASVNNQLEWIVISVVKGFDRLDRTLQAKADKADMKRVLGMLDDLLKKHEISDEERLVMGHHLERLDLWTHQLAKRIGYELPV